MISFLTNENSMNVSALLLDPDWDQQNIDYYHYCPLRFLRC